MRRDFSETAEQSLNDLIDQINDEQWRGWTDAIGDFYTLGLAIYTYLDSVNSYYENIFYKKNTTKDEIEKIFQDVRGVDSVYQSIFETCCDHVKEQREYIEQLAASIDTTGESTFNVENITIQLSSFSMDIEVLLDSEYKKMVTHNPDGSITLNIEYISSLFQQEAITGHPNKVEATYLALIKTFDSITTSEDMEAFLNSCYMKVLLQIRPTSYSFSYDEVQDKDPYRYASNSDPNMPQYAYNLTPVFTEMMRYYNNEIPSVFNELIACEDLSDARAKKLRKKLDRAGILQSMNAYGYQSCRWEAYETPCQPIKIKMRDDFQFDRAMEMQINSHMTISIVQYYYSKGLSNVFNGNEVGIDYIESTLVTYQQALEGVAIAELEDRVLSKIINTIPGGAFAREGSALTVDIIKAALEVEDENDAPKNAIDALEVVNTMAAFGIDAQLYTVNGKIQFDYYYLDSNTLLKHLGAFNFQLEENRKEQLEAEGKPVTGLEPIRVPIDALWNSSEDKKKFINFFIEGQNGTLKSIENEVGGVDKLIDDYTTQYDRDILDQSIVEQITGH